MSKTNPTGGAGSGTDRLRQTAEEARDAAAERWEEAKHEARETAEDAVRDARRRAENEAERGKAAGAGHVHQWASALDRAAGELGRESMQGQLLRQASEGLDDIARSIEKRSVGEMVDSVADFGRRNPLAFVGGAMMVGFALSRFATASPPRPERNDIPERTQTGARPSAPAPSPPPAPAPAPSPASGPATSFAAGGAPAAGAPNPADSGDKDELELTDSMRPEDGPGTGPTTAPGTASAPSGTDRPYPSAGPVPGADDREEDEK